MLDLITGRAGAGKTSFVLNDIRLKMDAGETGLLLIVPEQYSHDAERRLCAICGDRLSLHGETLSFTRLCERVLSETGGAPAQTLDAGGRTLVMFRALESIAQSLKVFGAKSLRAEMLENLLDAVKEFKTLNISSETLMQAAGRATSPLADKLHDLALIFQAYDALLHTHGVDASDRLALLADKIGESTVGDAGHIYFDGFNDFTEQELLVIEELLKKNAKITVCLTYDQQDDGEIFEIPRKTAERLTRMAKNINAGAPGQPPGRRQPTAGRDARTVPRAGASPELEHLEKHLFTHKPAQYPGHCGAITLYAAPTVYAQCEYAAQKVWELVRSGYRWRDVGVMARDWEQSGPICENVFEKYGVPFFSSGRADILAKPPLALIDAALEIAVSGWEYKPVFRYLKTGLVDVTPDECAELENYVIKWGIRGHAWRREWTLPAAAHSAPADALDRLNSLRRKITQPLLRLRDNLKGVTEAGAKLRAAYAFLEETKLPERLAEKAGELKERFDARLADEYEQLWGAIIGAMDQFNAILGGTEISAVEFRKLFMLTLSRYDVGVIPVSLDRTPLGGMAMSRRRDLKCLIVIGATDENIPMLSKDGGALSDSERVELSKLGADMPCGLEDRLCREMNMIYSTLTLPSRELVVMYPAGGGERPSFIVKRIKAMFGIKETATPPDMGAPPAGGAARAVPPPPGRQPRALPAKTASRLYGTELSLSATRVEKYYSCPYQHFLQSGLRLKQRAPIEFDAPAAGIFMHYVLEGVSRDIKEGVGFKNADEELCRALTAHHIGNYVRDVLFDFEGKNARFIYLFRRLEEDVLRIVLDMQEELKTSDFEPLGFELDIKQLTGAVKGVVDRVDGWPQGGKLYVRVVDYKTGRKAFDLSDVVHGRDIQLLLYLFALQKYGGARYGAEIVPAGALYVPARDVILKATRNATEAEITKKRSAELRRHGLILGLPPVLEAMENGEEKKYLPVKVAKDGGVSGNSLVSPAQIASLSKYVGHMLRRAAGEILGGGIECSPYFKNNNDNACLYCEYRTVCAFDEEAGDRRRYIRKLKPDEIWELLDHTPAAW